MDWTLEVVVVPVDDVDRAQLVVSDAYAAHGQLVAQGVAAGDVNVLDDREGGTMFEFADPDGNAWVVQQIKAREGTPLLPN